MHPATIILAILSVCMLLFIWGRFRYDVIALGGLMTAVLLHAVHFSDAYSGLSNPAVITVMCVMIMTRAITLSGLVDKLVDKMVVASKSTTMHLCLLTGLAGILSGFMNNVAALALLMPVAIETAQRQKRSPSLVLMPLAFASVLGGLVSLIGTPPNLLIAAFRQKSLGQPFAMFDFAKVGLSVAVVGIVFLALLGWRLLPERRKAKASKADLYQMQDYLSEIKIPDGSDMIGKPMSALETLVPGDLIIVGLIREGQRKNIYNPSATVQAKDIFTIEASHDDLHQLVESGKFELMVGQQLSSELLRSKEVDLIEAVVQPGSRVVGRSSQSLRLRSRLRMNLLAIARHGSPLRKRIHELPLQAGDVVLLQGEREGLIDGVVRLGLLPLVKREAKKALTKRAMLPIFLFVAAILASVFHVLPVQVAFTITALLMVVLDCLPMRFLYDSVDWSVIILLAAFIPLGGALQQTGGTAMIAQGFLHVSGHLSPAWVVGLLMFFTMTLSDLMNNAATTVIMAPIAMSLAQAYQVHVDPLLMAVAIGASCSFLTPVAHQNNTLVMGPGGYKFLDYMRLGLPLELLVLAVAWPMVLIMWPL